MRYRLPVLSLLKLKTQNDVKDLTVTMLLNTENTLLRVTVHMITMVKLVQKSSVVWFVEAQQVTLAVYSATLHHATCTLQRA